MIKKERLLKATKKTIYVIAGIIIGIVVTMLIFGNFEFSIMGLLVTIVGVIAYFISNYFREL